MATGPRTWRKSRAAKPPRSVSRSFSARPVLHRIRAHRHDDAARDLVVPCLLLAVPEHPEVAEQARDRREDPREIAEDPAARADRPAGAEVVDPNTQRALADRL